MASGMCRHGRWAFRLSGSNRIPLNRHHLGFQVGWKEPLPFNLLSSDFQVRRQNPLPPSPPTPGFRVGWQNPLPPPVSQLSGRRYPPLNTHSSSDSGAGAAWCEWPSSVRRTESAKRPRWLLPIPFHWRLHHTSLATGAKRLRSHASVSFRRRPLRRNDTDVRRSTWFVGRMRRIKTVGAWLGCFAVASQRRCVVTIMVH